MKRQTIKTLFWGAVFLGALTVAGVATAADTPSVTVTGSDAKGFVAAFDCGAPASAIAVWLLVDKHGRRNGWCEMTSDDLAFSNDRTSRAVRGVERRLCELGFLERRRVSGGGRQLREVSDRNRKVPAYQWVPWSVPKESEAQEDERQRELFSEVEA